MHHRPEKRGDRPDEALDLTLGETFADVAHSFRARFHPQGSVRVAHHFGHVRISEGGQGCGAEFAAELRVQPLLLFGMRRSHGSAPPSRLSCTAVSPFTFPDRTTRWTVRRQLR